MFRNWYDLASRLLGEGDEIQKCYDGHVNGKYGWLIISDKKVLFLHEVGFVSKEYSPIFEILRENIAEVTPDGTFGLIITDNLGNYFKFKTLEFPSKFIILNLESPVEAPQNGVMLRAQ